MRKGGYRQSAGLAGDIRRVDPGTRLAGGKCQEQEILRECYLDSLEAARKKGVSQSRFRSFLPDYSVFRELWLCARR